MLSELIEADWDQQLNLKDVVTRDQAIKWYKHGWAPTSGGGSTLDKVELEWHRPLREMVSHPLSDIQRLLKATDCDIDNVRVVFAFDN